MNKTGIVLLITLIALFSFPPTISSTDPIPPQIDSSQRLECAALFLEQDEVAVEISKNNTETAMYIKLGEALSLKMALIKSEIITNTVIGNEALVETQKEEMEAISEDMSDIGTTIKNNTTKNGILKYNLLQIRNEFVSNSCGDIKIEIDDFKQACEDIERIYDTVNCRAYRGVKEKDWLKT